jgi:hypothetical protein
MALTDNLQAFYKLSDTSDSSGNNRTLTNNGNVSFASGKIGDAGVFDGSNYLTLNTNGSFSFASGITFSGWLKQTDISESENKFFGLIPQNGLPFYASILNSYLDGAYNGQVFADMGHGADNFSLNESNSARLQLDTWEFVAIAVDNTNWSLWINDFKVTFPTPAAINSETINEIIIGAGSQGPYDAPFNGSIDAVGIWNRALNDAEVAALYNNGTGLELDGVAQPTLVKMQAPVKFFGKIKFGV